MLKKVRVDNKGIITKNKIFRNSLCLLSLMFFIMPAAAQSIITDDGYYPASIRSAGSARAAAIGSSYISFANDPSAAVLNPAGLAYMENFEIGLHHNSGLEDLLHETITAGMRLKGIGGIAVVLNYSDSGLFERRDEAGALLEGLNGASEKSLWFGWGNELPAGISAGISMAYSVKTTAETNINIFAMTAGLNAELSDFFMFSAALTGAGFEGSPVEIAARTGFMFEAGLDDGLGISAALTGEFDGLVLSGINAGAEASLMSSVFIRAGYTHYTVEQMSGGISGFSAGAGVRFDGIQIDYAFVPYGNLGSSHRISMSYSPVISHAPLPEKEERIFLPKSDNRVISFEAVKFGHDKYKLTYNMKELLRRNIEILKANENTEIRIAGHTSMSGSQGYNKTLSELRALSIRNFLIREGDIPAGRIFIIGYGNSRPVILEPDPHDVESDAAKLNRRGLFEIVTRNE